MISSSHIAIVVFFLDGQRFALPCSIVKRITNIVEITPLPNAPSDILGIINIHGQIVLVLNIRKKLDLAINNYSVNDYLIIVEINKKMISFIANDVNFYEFQESNIVSLNKVINGIECVKKVIKDEIGLINILDADEIFTSEFLDSNFTGENVLIKNDRG